MKTPDRHALQQAPKADIQELLKILQFRYGREVGFRPVVVRSGLRYYPIDGKLRAESEIVSWTADTDPNGRRVSTHEYYVASEA
jgi:hypothetical protein